MKLVEGGVEFDELSTAQEEEDSVIVRKRGEVDAACNGAQDLFLSGDEDGAMLRGREEVEEEVEVIKVIPDKEPVGMGGEPALNSGDDALLVSLLVFRELKDFSEMKHAGDNAFSGFRLNPEKRLIMLSIAISIFDSYLSFANATQTGESQYLCKRDWLWRSEPRMYHV